MAIVAKIAKIALKVVGYLVGGVVTLVLGLLIAVYFLLQSESFTGFVLGRVLPSVGTAICADIEVESLSLRLLPLRLEINGAKYTDPEGKFPYPFAAFDKLLLTVKTAPLLSGTVVVSKLSLEGVESYTRLDGGLANLPLCPSKPKPEEPKEEPSGEPFQLKLPIVIDDLHLDGTVRFDMVAQTPAPTAENPEPKPGSAINVSVGALTLDAKGDLRAGAGGVDAKLRIGDASFLIGDMYDQVQEIAIDATANLQSWEAWVPALSIRMADLALSGTAEAKDLLGELELAADLGLDVNLAKVNQLVLTKPGDMQLAGDLNLKTTAGLKLGKDAVTYQADGTVAMPSGRVNELALRNLNLVFAANEKEARVKALHLETAGGELDVQAKVGMDKPMPLTANVKIAALDVGDALKKFGLKDLPIAAIVDADLSAGGRLNPLSVDAKGQIDVADVAYGDAVAVKHVNVILDATAQGDTNRVRELRVTADQIGAGGSMIPQATVLLVGDVGPKHNVIKTLQVKTNHTRVSVDGTANPAGALNLNAAVELDDLAEFEGFVGKKLGGRGRLDAKIGGTVKKPAVAGTLKFADVVFDKTMIQSIAAELGMNDNRATVDGLIIEAGATALRLDAAYDMSGEKPLVDARLHMPETQIVELLKIAGMQKELDVKGVAALDAQIQGPIEHLNGTVAFHGNKIKAYGEKVEKINLDVELNDGLVVINDLSIVKNRSIRPIFHRGLWRSKPEKDITEQDHLPAIIKVSGQVHPFEKTFKIRLRTTNLTETASDTVVKERILAMANIGLNADLVGTFDNPGAEIDLAITSGRYDHLDLGDSTLRIRLKEKQVLVTGELLASRVDVDLNEQEHADRERRQDDPAWNGDLPGKQAMLGDDDDGPNDPADEDPDFGGAAEPATAPDGAAKPGKDLGVINIRASLGLEADMPLDARIDFAHFDYANFLKSREMVKREVQSGKKKERTEGKKEATLYRGMINGSIVASGALAKERPGEVDADGKPVTGADVAVEVRFDELLFQQNKFVIRNQNERGDTVPLQVRYENGQVSVPSFALGGNSVKINLASGPLRGEDFLVLTGEVDLGVASNFAEALAESTGMFNVQAEIPVAFDLDKVVAHAWIPEANFVIQNVPTAIERLNLDVVFENRIATVESLSADIGGGKLTGGGTFKLPVAEPKDAKGRAGDDEVKSGPQLDLFIKLVNIKTGVDPYIELALNKVDFIISNRPDGKIDISGDIDIAKANATYEVDLITILKMLQSSKSGAAGSETYEKKEESVFFNIGVRADRNVVFENNLAMLEMKLDLLLTGSNVDTGMIGTVDIIKGHAQVWNNDYKVTNATVQFVDETRIYPAFDINAKTDVRGGEIVVLVNVAGTPDKLNVSLSSDPPKTERDIMALLTVGVSYEEFQQGGSGIGGEQALALAAQSLLGNRVSSYTGLDIGIDNSRGVAMVKASTELEKDLTAAVFQAISDETLVAELEYAFIRYMAVYTDWSNFAGQENSPPSGGFGAGIRVKIVFR